MQTLKFKTNIQCGGCIGAVTPYLNKIAAINHWEVDTKTPDKVLTVQADVLQIDEVIAALKSAGYRSEKI
jgi:copper chaperone